MKQVQSNFYIILDDFFDEDTMSVHFKEDVNIFKKKGGPGNRESTLEEDKPSKNYLQNIINELYKVIEKYSKSFLEIDKNLSKVMQVGPYRVIVVLPPLSNGIEITAVKPIKKLSFEDYEIEGKTKELLEEKAEGILICGPPGEGKTTFAQALLEKYVNNKKIVKTLEAPRDLIVPPEVTQYSFSYAPHTELRDILLLARPDYTIYDEVRNSDDFKLFKDLRLTGIGLVGVIHGNTAVDSIQRFLGTIEMGLIPQVIDTIIFIKGGNIDIILNLKNLVKVPEGMESGDLARPVIQITDFYTDEVKYEIYSYGEEVVVMPLDKVKEYEENNKTSNLTKYGAEYVNSILREKFNFPLSVESESENSIKLYVPEKYRGQIIGKNGANINELEEMLGVNISLKTIDDKYKERNYKDEEIEYELVKKNKKQNAIIYLPLKYENKDVNIKIGDEIINCKTTKGSKITIKKPEIIKKIQEEGIKIV